MGDDLLFKKYRGESCLGLVEENQAAAPRLRSASPLTVFFGSTAYIGLIACVCFLRPLHRGNASNTLSMRPAGTDDRRAPGTQLCLNEHF